MKFALRLLVLALVLVSSGIFQSMACPCTSEVASANEEQEHGDCDDCQIDCGICIACPLSASTATPSAEPVAIVTSHGPVLAFLSDQPANAHPTDIFQPPEA